MTISIPTPGVDPAPEPGGWKIGFNLRNSRPYAAPGDDDVECARGDKYPTSFSTANGTTVDAGYVTGVYPRYSTNHTAGSTDSRLRGDVRDTESQFFFDIAAPAGSAYRIRIGYGYSPDFTSVTPSGNMEVWDGINGAGVQQWVQSYSHTDLQSVADAYGVFVTPATWIAEYDSKGRDMGVLPDRGVDTGIRIVFALPGWRPGNHIGVEQL